MAAEDLGKAIQEVIHYKTLRGKFSPVHPELRREGIVRVDVGEKGLHFVRDSYTGDMLLVWGNFTFKSQSSSMDAL